MEEKQGHSVHHLRDEMSSIHKRSFGGEESLAKRLDHQHQGKLGLSQDHYLVVGDQTRIDNVNSGGIFGCRQLASGVGGVGGGVGGGGLRLKSESEMFGGGEGPLRHERQPGIERLAGNDGALGERLSATEKFSRVAFNEERLGAKTHQLNAVENGALSRYQPNALPLTAYLTANHFRDRPKETTGPLNLVVARKAGMEVTDLFTFSNILPFGIWNFQC